ncbi:type 1 glutamine amidotransferase [Caulobacter segnis]|uniref:glutamine amidotransferase-related protein n=1 Tax=Caulobacter segnis TaxID=88688 RepID=UPI00240F054D|nr:type 1 glutamine amidotransferase [Caulobacter segnis]MDG2520386.1 type 1 glutamine amidotransferase [Caulobacter segnis]
MNIGILETGGPPDDLAGRFGGYGDMMRRMLGPSFSATTYNVRAGELPADGKERDAWLVTGSAAGVYDSDPWIADLKTFLRDASGAAPMVGICFGHQIMAEAFGGEVIKSPKGWGVGLHTYAVQDAQPWMDDAAPIRLSVSHQDQVIALPPGARVAAASDFTPLAMLAYRERRALSLQAHPEFEAAYTRALIESRRGSRIDEAFADQAIASLEGEDDRLRVAGWLRRFLTTA